MKRENQQAATFLTDDSEKYSASETKKSSFIHKYFRRSELGYSKNMRHFLALF
jgi:hypothetical protein